MSTFRRLLRAAAAVLLIALCSCAAGQARDEAQAEYNRGLSLFNRGKYDEAVPAFEKATELRPDWAEAYLFLGRAHLSLGRWREALPPLRAAFRIAPDRTRREAGELILDLLLHHAGDLDPLARSQFEELLKAP